MQKYFHDHFWMTTSAFFRHELLTLVLSVMGEDRVLFAVGYPSVSNRRGRTGSGRWICHAPLRKKSPIATPSNCSGSGRSDRCSPRTTDRHSLDDGVGTGRGGAVGCDQAGPPAFDLTGHRCRGYSEPAEFPNGVGRDFSAWH